ncbi:protein-tyrosine phosphatase family protein [Desulfopila inferna]|uniref:protein-tyrosine phosphatase family protein n=1 Tax=Desulfopila inferna TaxID=468528 RepID=UPI00196284A0|nr:dual specificity protein phosphatase family protein [Desulfopila inferna]MBM9604990.1 dual specificity protein phosphatase family protein [Desulfopila inferna]
MSHYPVTWITANIGAGRAPQSFDELKSIREQGIGAIINLCGEYSDLHELEEQSGLEVLWIPVADETAPTMSEMERGLEWLDEAVYLDKKVLIHCRHGIGRTGTFITAYLLRRGFDLKKAGKILKATQANPTNFSQWWLLRKFGKKEGQLLYGEPTPENRSGLDLSEFYDRYERLIEKAEALSAAGSAFQSSPTYCSAACPQNCRPSFSLELIEALYLHHKVNTILTTLQRQTVLQRTEIMRKFTDKSRERTDTEADSAEDAELHTNCPLLEDKTCLLYRYRPLHCRLQHSDASPNEISAMKEELSRLSKEVFLNIFGKYNDKNPPAVPIQDSISGRFIQNYFRLLVSNGKSGK